MSRWDALLAVQEHDTSIDQLVHRQRTLPARSELDGVMAEISKVQRRVAEVEAARHELARDQQRLEDEISTVSTKAQQHDATLYSGSVTNPRELQAMQEEIASLKRRIGQLEDHELEVMEQIEPLDADLAQLAGQQASLDEQASTLRGSIAEQEVELDDKLTAVRAERDELAAGIEPELMTEYEQVRRGSGGIAIARLVGGHCGGCHLALSAVELDRIKHLPSEAPAHCDECGRLLAR